MRRVLLIAYNYPPDPVAGSARPARFARYLPRYGYEAKVLTATGAGPDVRVVADRPPGWVRRLWRLLPETAMAWSGPAAGAALEMVRAQPHGARIDAMISTAPPFATHCPALWVKRKEPRIKWIADFRDPLAGSPGRRRTAQRLFDPHLEEMVFEQADAVVANTDAVADLWRERYPRWRGKIFVIWNGYDPCDSIEAAPIPPRPWKLLLHVGDLYPKRHPGPVVEALERADAAGRLRLRLIGGPPEDTGDAERYRRAIEAGLVEFLPRVKKAEADAAMAEADYLLLLDMQRENEPALQLPSKIFDYVRIGRPILAVTTAGSPVEWVLERSGIPAVVMRYTDPPETNARRLQELLALPSAPSAMSDWFSRTFNGDTQTAALAGILDRCLDAR